MPEHAHGGAPPQISWWPAPPAASLLAGRARHGGPRPHGDAYPGEARPPHGGAVPAAHARPSRAPGELLPSSQAHGEPHAGSCATGGPIPCEPCPRRSALRWPRHRRLCPAVMPRQAMPRSRRHLRRPSMLPLRLFLGRMSLPLEPRGSLALAQRRRRPPSHDLGSPATAPRLLGGRTLVLGDPMPAMAP